MRELYEVGNHFPPDRGDPDQAPHGTGGPQEVRQAGERPAPGDDGQRRLLLQAPPEGGTPRWHHRNQTGPAAEDPLPPRRSPEIAGGGRVPSGRTATWRSSPTGAI